MTFFILFTNFNSKYFCIHFSTTCAKKNSLCIEYGRRGKTNNTKNMNGTAITITGISFIFLMTTLGASLVLFLKKEPSKKLNSLFLGFASGIMIAASIWSLLLPSIEMSCYLNNFKFVPALIGFLFGSTFIFIIDKFSTKITSLKNTNKKQKITFSKSTKLFLAVTIHNIPEGLAVGFAFGFASNMATQAALLSALSLAIGIGIQNFPEGTAVSLPMVTSGKSKSKAFLIGTLSGIVEPIFAILGYFLAYRIQFIQPWLLSFSAGAMIYVVAEDLIPDAKLESHPHLGTWGVILGFAIMMTLDIALG